MREAVLAGSRLARNLLQERAGCGMRTKAKRMSETEAISPREGVSFRKRGRAKGRPAGSERRTRPRPRLAEIKQGASLNLVPPVVVAWAVRMIEFLIVAALGFGIYVLYVGHEGQAAHLIYLSPVLLAASANLLLLQMLDLYRVPAFAAFVTSFTRIAAAWTVVMGGIMVLAFFFKMGSEFSRVWLATWYATALVTLFGERLVLSFLVRRWIAQGRRNRRAVIVGGGPEAERLIAALEASHDTDIRIVGIFDDRGDDRVSPIVAGWRGTIGACL